MPYEDSKVLKYNHREKSLKALFCISFDTESLLLKMPSCQIILKNLTQRKNLTISLQVTHGLHVDHLMHQKTNLVITEGKTV